MDAWTEHFYRQNLLRDPYGRGRLALRDFLQEHDVTSVGQLEPEQFNELVDEMKDERGWGLKHVRDRNLPVDPLRASQASRMISENERGNAELAKQVLLGKAAIGGGSGPVNLGPQSINPNPQINQDPREQNQQIELANELLADDAGRRIRTVEMLKNPATTDGGLSTDQLQKLIKENKSNLGEHPDNPLAEPDYAEPYGAALMGEALNSMRRSARAGAIIGGLQSADDPASGKVSYSVTPDEPTFYDTLASQYGQQHDLQNQLLGNRHIGRTHIGPNYERPAYQDPVNYNPDLLRPQLLGRY